MPDIEKVIAGLTMLVDRENDNTCEGLKCCKIATDALVLLKELVRCKECKYHYNEIRCRCGGFTPDDWFCAGGKRRTDDA